MHSPKPAARQPTAPDLDMPAFDAPAEALRLTLQRFDTNNARCLFRRHAHERKTTAPVLPARFQPIEPLCSFFARSKKWTRVLRIPTLLLLSACTTAQMQGTVQQAVNANRTSGAMAPARVGPGLQPMTVPQRKDPPPGPQSGGRQTEPVDEYRPGRYSGPPRWGFDEDYADSISQLGVFLTGTSEKRDYSVSGDVRTILGGFTLFRHGSKNISFWDIPQRLQVPASLLECEYRVPGGRIQNRDAERDFVKMWFWQTGTRQALNNRMLKPYKEKSDHIADVEQEVCPVDLASALSVGFGDGWPSVAQKALQSRDAVVKRNLATGLWNPIDYSQWDKNPKALTPAEERALAREIDQVLKSLEAFEKEPSNTVYYTALHQKLQPAMAKLAASGLAQANKIAPGEAGRKAFEQWDFGIGYAVVSLSMRLHRWKQPGPLFTMVLDRYRTLYDQQFADKGALDRKYMAQMLASIAKYKVEQADTTAPSVETSRQERVWVMRPRQSLLYRSIDKGVRVVQEYTQARAKIKQALDNLEREIASSRNAFWACYEKRCADGGVLYYKFSASLIELDRFMITRTALKGAVGTAMKDKRHGETMAELMGLDREVNQRYTGACDYEYGRFFSQFTDWLSLDAVTMKRRLDEALGSEDYLNVQRCRDSMEFIMRPRPANAGLM